MKSEENPKLQNEALKNFSRNGGYFHINISNSLVLLERYRVSVDTPVTVSQFFSLWNFVENYWYPIFHIVGVNFLSYKFF